jgi:elongator complex protein 2
MTQALTDYISVGGNRNTSAADWDCETGEFAFGADQNVAIWKPHFDKSQRGVFTLLRGHDDKVTAVKYIQGLRSNLRLLITGSAAGELRGWSPRDANPDAWRCATSVKAHEGSLNAIAILPKRRFFSTAGADATVKLWDLESDTLSLVHVIALKPRYIPLALALGEFFPGESSDHIYLAVGGTRSQIQIHTLTKQPDSWQNELQATLSGHEGWVRSLGLRLPRGPKERDILLASASQDKYVRLWRIHKGEAKFAQNKTPINEATGSQHTLMNKVQTIRVPGAHYSITFDALLVGHEDWIYTLAWSPYQDSLQLLTASADNSLMVWEPDLTSGIWFSTDRIGEISGQKGATTATGSAGGFWIGLWSPDGLAVTCLARTGSWRLWENDTKVQYWSQKPSMSGHVGPVTALAWDKNGKYLLSAGSDQTTRLHAEWKRESHVTWHEFARPQIHGYNLNCLASIGPHQFVSGADEKLLRVFNEPRTIASMMERLCKIGVPDLDSMAEAANMPVLGLSNKAIDARDEAMLVHDRDTGARDGGETLSIARDVLEIDEPPSEDVLARHTLWPEHEKLYGHGYEISEVASNIDGTIIASACKASSINHAVIRLYNTENWQELKPPLTAHSLTVTRLRFSSRPNNFLLSVGRDRQWTVFQQPSASVQSWKLFDVHPKAHSRMIMDAAWSTAGPSCFFATAGRDKLVKLWQLEDTTFVVRTSVSRESPITSIDLTCDREQRWACLAIGEENGQISIHILHASTLELAASMDIDVASCPSKAVTRLAWRPEVVERADVDGSQLAAASADSSVRIINVRWQSACNYDASNDISGLG